MKTIYFSILTFLLAGSALAATDITPKPGDPGNLGSATNKFPVIYGTNGNFETIEGDGSAITGLNASALGSGTVPAARLSTATTASPGDNDTSIATTAFVEAAKQNSTNNLHAAAFTGNAISASQWQPNYEMADRNAMKLPGTYARLHQHEPHWFTFFGDDAIHVSGPVLGYLQRHGMKLSNSGKGLSLGVDDGGGFGFLGASAGVTSTTTHGQTGGPLFPITYFGMPDGGVVSNYSSLSTTLVLRGWKMTHVNVRGWKNTGLGTLAVQTNNGGWNATTGWGTLATIDCNAGSDFTPYNTNFYIGQYLNQGSTRVVSTGTNVLFSVSGYNTNLDAGIVAEQWLGANIGMQNVAGWTNYPTGPQNPYYSNAFAVFLKNTTLFAVSDIGDLQTGVTNLSGMIRDHDLQMDVSFNSTLYTRDTVDGDAAWQYQTNFIWLANTTPYSFVDLGRWVYPTNRLKFGFGDTNTLSYFSGTDTVHASPMGHSLMGAIYATKLFPEELLARLGYEPRRTNSFFVSPEVMRHPGDPGTVNTSSRLVSPNTVWGVNYGGSAIVAGPGAAPATTFSLTSKSFPYENPSIDFRMVAMTTNQSYFRRGLAFYTWQNGAPYSASDTMTFGPTSQTSLIGQTGRTNINYTDWLDMTPPGFATNTSDWYGYYWIDFVTTSPTPTNTYLFYGTEVRYRPRIPNF